MDAYIFNADVYCEDCAADLMDELDKAGEKDTGDSGDYPQGPYSDGGGEADTPQHCASCHVALDNPLTSDGVEYVLEHARESLQEPRADRDRIMPLAGTAEDEPGFTKTWGGKRHVEIVRGWVESIGYLGDNPEGDTPSARRPARFAELYLYFTRDTRTA